MEQHQPAGRRWRRRCWRRSTWWEPSWWLWGCGVCRRSGSLRSGSAHSARRGGWRRTTQSPTTETRHTGLQRTQTALQRQASAAQHLKADKWFNEVRKLNRAADLPKDDDLTFKFLTWMTPITITQPQKSKIPRMFSGKVAIKENCKV